MIEHKSQGLVKAELLGGTLARLLRSLWSQGLGERDLEMSPSAVGSSILHSGMRFRVGFAGALLSVVPWAPIGQATAEEQLVSPTGTHPALAIGGNGNAIVVWQDIDDGRWGQGVFGQLLDAEGLPLTSRLEIAASNGDQVFPRVAADAKGNFVAVWQGGREYVLSPRDPGGDGQGTGIFGQRFDHTGVKLGRRFRVSRDAAGFQRTPSVAMAPNGAFVAAWTVFVQTGPDPSYYIPEVWAGRFSASGKRREPDLRMNLEGRRLYENPFVVHEQKGFAVGWSTTEDCPIRYARISFVISHFTSSGQPAAVPPHRREGECYRAGWRLGAFVSSGAGSLAAQNGGQNHIQLFGPSGEPAGRPIKVGPRTTCFHFCEFVAAAAMNETGHFALVWEVPGLPYRHDLYAQFFRPDGQPVGARFRVNHAPAKGWQTPAAALANDGTLFIAWQRLSLVEEEAGLFLRRFKLAG